MVLSLARRPLIARSSCASRQLIASRQIQVSSRQLAQKDAQHKDDLKPSSNEYSKSASDDKSAGAIEETAFDPSTTSPEGQQKQAGKESNPKDSNNPLDVSPANHDVSQPRDTKEGGAESSSAESGKGPSDRERTSGGGSSPKTGGGKHGGGS